MSGADRAVFDLQTYRIELTIPARLDLLSILGTALREFCAVLPGLVKTGPEAADIRRQVASTTATTGIYNFSQFVYSLELVVQEAASNIVRHGYGEQPGGLINLKLEIEESNQSGELAVIIELADSASHFDPTGPMNLQLEPPGFEESGYGLYLIKVLTDRVIYRRDGGRNHLRLEKIIG